MTITTMQSDYIYDYTSSSMQKRVSLVSRCTGKERDTESGLDYFGARYYGSSLGRFMSPDPSGLYFADPTNPQSLNLYSYALNNPLKFTDPTGLYCYYGDPNSASDSFDINQYDFHSSQAECTKADENGNQGQWIDDAYTHNGVDIEGRPEEAVSSTTTTSDDMAIMVSPIATALAAYTEQNRISLQFNGDHRVYPWKPTDSFSAPPRLSDSYIKRACAMAVLTSGGGNVIAGYGSLNQESEGAPDQAILQTNSTMRFSRSGAFQGTDTTKQPLDLTSTGGNATGNAVGFIASAGGTYANCVSAVSAANDRESPK